jgi:hypothetical protein
MKNVSGTIKFVILPAFVVCSVIVLRPLQAEKKGGIEAPYVLYYEQPRELKNGDVKEFEKVLSKQSNIYCMKHHEKDQPGKPGKDTPLKKNCTMAINSTSSVNPDGSEYTLICTGAHVTQSAGFATKAAMQTVVDLFK